MHVHTYMIEEGKHKKALDNFLIFVRWVGTAQKPFLCPLKTPVSATCLCLVNAPSVLRTISPPFSHLSDDGVGWGGVFLTFDAYANYQGSLTSALERQTHASGLPKEREVNHY